MKYIEYALSGQDQNTLYNLHSSFSGCTYYNNETDLYYGTYDDAADMNNLPSWASEITSTEYDTAKAAVIALGKASLKEAVEAHGNRIVAERYPELSELLMESTYAQNAIPGLTADADTPTSGDMVVVNANTILSGANTLTDLHNELDAIPDYDSEIAAIIPTNTNATYVPAIKAYYRTVMEGVVKFRLRRLVKDWIVTKQATVDGYTEAQLNTVDVITFMDDCPDI